MSIKKKNIPSLDDEAALEVVDNGDEVTPLDECESESRSPISLTSGVK